MKISNLEEFYKKINSYDRHMGLDFSIDGPGDITYHLEVTKIHLSSPGTAHGAVTAGMMDATLGMTALSHAVTEDKFCSTVEFKINFITPVKEGDVLIGKGQIDHKGKSLVIVSGQIKKKEDNKLVATGLGTFNLYPMEKKDIEQWIKPE
ncbi:MAG: PaaI family thioesterase [Halobacteriovoraceae bacterium]|nr:PaaI family thioesterase [Halobacteriovoraceae bacterium]